MAACKRLDNNIDLVWQANVNEIVAAFVKHNVSLTSTSCRYTLHILGLNLSATRSLI